MTLAHYTRFWLTVAFVVALLFGLPALSQAQYCTMDAMQCPDGSFVGRSGPNCEFVCPGTVQPDYGEGISGFGGVDYYIMPPGDYTQREEPRELCEFGYGTIDSPPYQHCYPNPNYHEVPPSYEVPPPGEYYGTPPGWGFNSWTPGWHGGGWGSNGWFAPMTGWFGNFFSWFWW